jgi:dTDP-4-dehydrorhamnose 3,5-epimerase
VSYELGAFHAPNVEGGLRHDDPKLGLEWPLPVTAISPRDRGFQPLAQVEAELRRRMALSPRQPPGQRQETLVAF